MLNRKQSTQYRNESSPQKSAIIDLLSENNMLRTTLLSLGGSADMDINRVVTALETKLNEAKRSLALAEEREERLGIFYDNFLLKMASYLRRKALQKVLRKWAALCVGKFLSQGVPSRPRLLFTFKEWKFQCERKSRTARRAIRMAWRRDRSFALQAIKFWKLHSCQPRAKKAPNSIWRCLSSFLHEFRRCCLKTKQLRRVWNIQSLRAARLRLASTFHNWCNCYWRGKISKLSDGRISGNPALRAAIGMKMLGDQIEAGYMEVASVVVPAHTASRSNGIRESGGKRSSDSTHPHSDGSTEASPAERGNRQPRPAAAPGPHQLFPSRTPQPYSLDSSDSDDPEAPSPTSRTASTAAPAASKTPRRFPGGTSAASAARRAQAAVADPVTAGTAPPYAGPCPCRRRRDRTSLNIA